MLSTVEVFGAGTTGVEEVELQIDGSTVQTWNDLGDGAYSADYRSTTWTTDQTITPNQVRIQFTNDLYDPDNNVDRNVRIDQIRIDGVTYQTEADDVFSTGTWLPEDGVVAGNRSSEYLHADGYFQYAEPGNDDTTNITVNARGNEGTESFALQVDEVTVQTWNDVSTTDTAYTLSVAGTVTADQIRVVFLNDQYDPAAGIDRNLIVDNIVVDGVQYQTEGDQVYSTGTWQAEDGFTDGFRNSETLHGNGYFQYEATPVVTNPGSIGLTLNSISVDEAAGEINFIVFRADGTDGRVTVDYATQLGTADSDDFQDAAGTLVFEEGITGQQVSVAITNDNQIEDDESFSLVLSNPTGGATLAAITTQTVVILDNDEVAAGVIFEDGFEGSTAWTTNPNGTDTATTGFWEAGAPSETISGSTVLQPDSGHTGSRALVTGLAAGTSVGTYDIDNGNTSVVSPEIALPQANEIALSFEYSFAYLDNATGDDYFQVAIVSAGTTDILFTDHAHNANQSSQWLFKTLDLSAYAGQTIQIQFEAADADTGSLIEAAVDDVIVEVLPNLPGTISVATTGINLDESAGVATVKIVRNTGRAGEVSVDYTTVAGSASTADFTSRSGTIVFADGQAEAEITIAITDDNLEEQLESFEFRISNPTGGAILGSEAVGTITIVDNDNTIADFLPDLTPIASTLGERLSIDTSEQPGRELLRFSTEVANAGTGPLEIWGGTASGDSQQVFQRIYQEGGGSRDILAGEFVYHPGHGHIHFEAFATYDLKLINASGEIIASGGKTSFCLINIRQPLPDVSANADVVHGRGGTSCGNIQGISAGYSDVYSASLDDQWIDITNVADGTYWLEITADPDNNILESNESNNVSRIQVAINNGQVSSL
jgi:hypothetical protein